MSMHQLIISLTEHRYRQLVNVAISNGILPADAAENIICSFLYELEKKGELK